MMVHKLCPMWRKHTILLFNLKLFKTYWFCKYCPLRQMRGVGRAYRITIGEENV